MIWRMRPDPNQVSSLITPVRGFEPLHLPVARLHTLRSRCSVSRYISRMLEVIRPLRDPPSQERLYQTHTRSPLLPIPVPSSLFPRAKRHHARLARQEKFLQKALRKLQHVKPPARVRTWKLSRILPTRPRKLHRPLPLIPYHTLRLLLRTSRRSLRRASSTTRRCVSCWMLRG